MAVEYAKKTNAELIEILKSRGLSHTGKKADMVARLLDADKAAPAPAQPAPVAEDVIDWDDDTADAPATATATAAKEAPKAAVEPSATKEEQVAKPVEGGGAAVPTPEAKAVETKPTKETAANGADKKTAEKPTVDYTKGLASTDLDTELAKRKARAAKFGVVDEPAVTEAQKALERAKRFGTAAGEESSPMVKGLDEALSTDRGRKRGRGEEADSGRGKRRNFPSRGRGGGGPPRRGARNEGNRNGASNKNNSSNTSNNNNIGGSGRNKVGDADRAAMEKRKERFAIKK